ncbi:MAG: penicillin-binding protein 2 [Rhodobacteraceae bacterium]|nr:penicillin-binding protein 2 [Paracoccaceae bacterium]
MSEPRRPLRPLAPVLRARERGENPDLIERENRARRSDALRDRLRRQAEGRLLVLSVFFIAAFAAVGVRMGTLATSVPVEPTRLGGGSQITSARADIVDRNGRLMATNLVTQALYAHPQEMVDIPGAVAQLAAIFPDIDAAALEARLEDKNRKFVWIRKTLSPEEIQAVYDIGDPGLLFASRDMRIYPNGHLAAHVLGGASFGTEGVNAAEVIGVAGIEKAFDDRLRDPAELDKPLQLSIDVTVQSAVTEVLEGGMHLMHAKGASAVIMDVHSGEIISMVSLPDFDPNDRPQPLTTGDQSDSPLFNRAVQGVYELGSVFKILTVSAALDEGVVNVNTVVNTQSPMRWGRFKISDFHNYGPSLSVRNVIVKSSNVGTAHIAQMLGGPRQKAFLESLGLFEPTPVELFEAPSGRPLLPGKWGEIQSMTISYGHGMSTSPVHLASAYSSLVNGGTLVKPTLLKQSGWTLGPQVIKPETSATVRSLLRDVVVKGTATFGNVPGYDVGGKTGSADKPRPNGGYYRDKVLATFAGTFPAHDPKYVFVVSLDEGYEIVNGQAFRTAGWTAVPVTAEIIRRIAPLLGLPPEIEPASADGVREARRG